MNNRVEPTSNNASLSGAKPLAASSDADLEDTPDESKSQFERLRRSVLVAKSLLRAIEGSRKLLDQFSAPFLEPIHETDSQKKINSRKNRQRKAVFSAAKDVLDPDHPIKLSVEKSLSCSADLDESIGANAREVKSKVLEPLDSMVNEAVRDANEQKSAEFVERFAGTVLELTREIDVRAQEVGILHEKFKSEFRQVQINRLFATRNIVAAMTILTAVIVGSVGYIKTKRDHSKALDNTVHAITKVKTAEKEAVSHPSEITYVSPKIIPVSSASASIQKNISESSVATKSPGVMHSNVDVDGGGVTISSGKDPETVKKNVRALGDAIRAWNAENDAQAARDKGLRR